MVEGFRVLKIIHENETRIAIVERERTTACGHCPSASICGVPRKLEMRVEVPDQMVLNPQDEVVLDMPEVPVTKLAFFSYGIPTMVFVLALFLFSEVFQMADVHALLLALIPLGSSFLLLRWVDRQIKGKYRPKIVVIRSFESTDKDNFE